MTGYEDIEDWVEDEYDPGEETPREFINAHDFPNPAAERIALKAARRIRKEGPGPGAEGDETIEGVVYDESADRLRGSDTGKFIGWVEAAERYIGDGVRKLIKRLGGF